MSREGNHTQSDSFIKGAFVLGISGIFVKVVGAFFRIPLANLLGPEGMGYYVSAYPIYNFFIVLATAGLPTALAKIISEQRAIGDYKNLDQTFKSGLLLMTLVGLFGSFFMYFGAGFLVKSINNPLAINSFRALAPAIVIVSIMAVFRGFFQGFQQMKPFALSQIFEQFARVIVGFGLAVYLLKQSTELAAAGATFGATTGAIAGLAIILFMYIRFRKKNEASFSTMMEGEAIPKSQLMKRIVLIAIPITLGAAVMPLMNTIDVMLVMNRLTDIGLGSQANDLYGMLVGYAATLVNLPQVVTSAIQISIVPAIAGFFIKDELKALSRTVQNGIRMTLIISLPAAAGLVVLARPIMELLYPAQIQHAHTTGNILSILGFTVIFLGLFQVSTGILQGMSMQNRPAFNLFIGAIVKIVLTYVLVGIPSVNIYGAAFSTVAAYATATILNLYTLKKHADVTFDVKNVFLKPFVAVLVMSVVVLMTYYGAQWFVSKNLSTVLGIFIGILIYFIMLFKTKTITEADFELMPGGSKIKKLARKFMK